MQRVIIKLSGEALNKQDNIVDLDLVSEFAHDVLKLINNGHKVAIVVGGGNIYRGRDYTDGIDRANRDYLGMLATCFNGYFLQSVFSAKGIPSSIFGAYAIDGIVPKYSRYQASQDYDNGTVVIFTGGIGVPFISTDCCSVMRGGELGADIVLKSTNIDGVYDKDPNKHSDAVRYDHISYNDYIQQGLRVVDPQAVMTASDLGIKILIFQSGKGAIHKILDNNMRFTTIG